MLKKFDATVITDTSAKKALTGTNVKFNFNTTDVNIDGCINALDITKIIKKILLS